MSRRSHPPVLLVITLTLALACAGNEGAPPVTAGPPEAGPVTPQPGATGGAGGRPGSQRPDAGAPAPGPVDAGAPAPAPVDAAAPAPTPNPPPATADAAPALPRFSFFVTSLAAMRKLSGSQDGFGGDLRHGEMTGLGGADKICREIAELSMPGATAKTWRAFLSTTRGGPDGGPVHAIDRVGEGPWYDRLGRLVAANRADLLQRRPRGADPAILNDLPNESGVPNHLDGAPGCTGDACPDNHDTLTGTNERGQLRSPDPGSTCNDWTIATRTGRPWCGHSWPRGVGDANWMSSLAEGGCAAGVNLLHQGGPNAPTVGSGGGYGGIYCFALQP